MVNFTIELLIVDLWDGPAGDPIIYHGRTLTSQVMLTDVLMDAIKPYAFKVSPYPLILSLESHLSKKQTRRLAFLLSDILGGRQVIHQVFFFNF
jgi:phosphatidylinositol phospholipase C delta